MNDDCLMCIPEDPATVLWRNARLRIVRIEQSSAGFVFPGFCRVIWNEHVAEMTDLATDDRNYLMEVVWTVETVLREVLRPDKINLASLGNVAPHLHWHLIPRWRDDSHFPQPIWGNPPEAKLATDPVIRQERLALVDRLGPELQKRLGAG